jgi:hypothetical protein
LKLVPLELAVFEPFRSPVLLGFNPCCTKPTVSVAFVIGSAFEPLIEIDATTEPGTGPPAVTPFALSRMLVMRKTRVNPVLLGGRTGTPKNVTWLPVTTPWKTLAPAVANEPPNPFPELQATEDVTVKQVELTGTPAQVVVPH